METIQGLAYLGFETMDDVMRKTLYFKRNVVPPFEQKLPIISFFEDHIYGINSAILDDIEELYVKRFLFNILEGGSEMNTFHCEVIPAWITWPIKTTQDNDSQLYTLTLTSNIQYKFQFEFYRPKNVPTLIAYNKKQYDFILSLPNKHNIICQF